MPDGAPLLPTVSPAFPRLTTHPTQRPPHRGGARAPTTVRRDQLAPSTASYLVVCPTVRNPPSSRDALPNPASPLLELILLHDMVDVATRISLNNAGPLEYLWNFSRIEPLHRKFGKILRSVAVTCPESFFG
jgi:hypothetical protein